MKSIVFFNNKGGVGKTTLTCNVCSYLSQYMGKQVLLIDADPQCNSTQILLGEDILHDLYFREVQTHKTLFGYLSPLKDGEAAIDTKIVPVPARETAFRTDLVPGHPRMSLIEDRLSRAWSDFQGGDRIPGYRTTNWISQLFTGVDKQYDYVVFDVGPSLGALNRTVLLSCDYVVTPFGSDIFSLLGIKNISSWIDEWGGDYRTALQELTRKEPGAITKYPGVTNIDSKHRFAGYSVQQYVARKFKTGKRPVKAFDDIMAIIPETVETHLRKFVAQGLDPSQLKLGDIPFLYSLAPLAQSHKVPIHELVNAKAVSGAQVKQVADYHNLMKVFCEQLLKNVGDAAR